MERRNDLKEEFDYKEIDYVYNDKIASANECTGLVPAIPGNDDEAEAYEDLYPVPKQGNINDIDEEVKDLENKK